MPPPDDDLIAAVDMQTGRLIWPLAPSTSTPDDCRTALAEAAGALRAVRAVAGVCCLPAPLYQRVSLAICRAEFVLGERIG